jgi:hypothetical protein
VPQLHSPADADRVIALAMLALVGQHERGRAAIDNPWRLLGTEAG